MSLNIKHKRSAVNGSAPTPAQLEDGELAVNYNTADPALYIKDSAGAVVRIAGDGAPGGGEWTRTGTELSPKTAGDDVFTSGDVKVGGTTGTPNIELNADGSAKFETATDFTPDSTGVLELRSSDTSVQAGTENTNLLRLVAATSNSTTAALIAVGKYEDSSFGRGELTIKVPDTSLSANLQEFKFRGDGKALLPGDVLIGGTLPSAPNISLNASGDVELAGDITNTTVDGDQDIICNGAGLIKLTEYNLDPMEVVTRHDIGTGANEVPVNGFLGTLAYQDDLAIQDGTTVASLPTSPTARIGNITRVTDGAAALTWGATVTGGGTAQYLVWYNGTDWTVFGA